jgi:hypothetical protein
LKNRNTGLNKLVVHNPDRSIHIPLNKNKVIFAELHLLFILTTICRSRCVTTSSGTDASSPVNYADPLLVKLCSVERRRSRNARRPARRGTRNGRFGNLKVEQESSRTKNDEKERAVKASKHKYVRPLFCLKIYSLAFSITVAAAYCNHG